MCFPTFKQSFCFCSLRTGVHLICGISLLWNIGWFFFDKNESPPSVLEILDSQNFFQLHDGHHFAEYRQYYYIIQIVVLILAQIGIFTTSSRCLYPLIMSEQLMIFIYVFATIHYGYMYYMRFSESKSIVLTSDMLYAMLFPILSVLHFYLCSIIYNLFIELLKGNDGSTVTTSLPESATSRNDHASSHLSPHHIQFPYDPAAITPTFWKYPPNFLKTEPKSVDTAARVPLSSVTSQV
ncbi:uncharacterized protein LOC135834507 isoform X2 [Planococcus citri]|uniref:uncharacterized protein LOC135834507 isoform X2 n=1 Tax=Planococcus citri TaxID=170843 RepID=UPI0031F7C399